jgi:type IV pilus assembly protein PilA
MTQIKLLRRRASGRGFTLIELMIAIAIVGVLAAISIPAYTDYLNRAKVSEAMAAINACKVSVTEFVAFNGALPTNADQAGCDSTPNTQYVAALSVSAGTISATIRNVHPDVNGDQLRIRPSSTPGAFAAIPAGSTEIAWWQCGADTAVGDAGRRLFAANCRAAQF